jgi:hypothetical protein
MSAERRPAQDAMMIAALLGPGEPELTCDECFDQLDRYVDLTIAGHDPAAAVPGMRAHLVGCPACAEDFDSLLAFVRHGDADAPPRPGG